MKSNHSFSFTETTRFLPTDIFTTLLVFGVFYRIKIHTILLNDKTLIPTSFKYQGWDFFHANMLHEFFFAAIIAALCWFGSVLLKSTESKRVQVAFRIVGWLVLLLFLVSVAFAYETHFRLVKIMQIGLTYEAIQEALQAFSWGAWLRYITWQDVIVIFTPILFLFMFIWLPKPITNGVNFLIVLSLIISLLHFINSAKIHLKSEDSLRLNPMLYVLRDSVKQWRKANFKPGMKKLSSNGYFNYARKRRKRSRNETRPPFVRLFKGPLLAKKRKENFLPQQQSLRLTNELFLNPYVPKKNLPAAKERKKVWNVLWIVLESVGASYIFDTSKGEIPMPFLRKFSKQCWYLKNHYSPSNSSARSLFSQLSGLYPNPQLKMFAVRRDVKIPSLLNFMAPNRDVFLIQPSLMTWFFPKWFLEHSGFRDMKGFYQLPLPNKHRPRAARNEIDTVDYFLQRLSKAKKPFYGIYHSYIAHWPYFDYGPNYQIRHEIRKKEDRYMNNLYLLDNLLKKIHKKLGKLGLLDNTIIVMAGDHGEAFGQHFGNWTHSRKSFNENYQTPAFLCQPKLFKPKIVTRMTSHIDIVPTLLDAMGKRYNKHLLQGDSLFQENHQQKYLFLYGNENTISSIARSTKRKMQYSRRSNMCWVYDLKSDPYERVRLSCDKASEQWEALWLYQHLQPQILERYINKNKAGLDYFGQKHPSIIYPYK